MLAFLFVAVGGIVGIQYDESSIASLPLNPYPGEPALPVDIRKFTLPPGAGNIRVVVDDIQMERIEQSALDFNDTIVIAVGERDSIIPIPRTAHPSPVLLEGYGRRRDSTIAVVRINPIFYDGKNTYRISRVAFHLEWQQLMGDATRPLPDSLDYLILTVSWLHPYVDSIAYLSRIRGFRTLVIDVDDIATNPERIRDTIRYFYRNFGIKYASIVAHASIIHPYLLRFHPDSVLQWYYPTGPLVYTDFPYMALDGEYYTSQDEFIGDGDDGTDMVADIGFSRIPVSTMVELEDYYRKLRAHIMGENPSTPGSLTCLESRLDTDTTSFAWLCETATYGLGIPRIQRMYEPYFDYLLTPEEFFDSLNALRPQLFIYLGHSNIDRILTTYYPRRDIFTSTYYALMDEFTIPISYIGGCWPGDPMSASMAVNLPRVDGKGSLFTMGASKLDYATNETMKARGILEGFFVLGKHFAGDVINYIREDYVGRRYFLYEIMTYGDPTLTIYRSLPELPPAEILFSGNQIGVMAEEDSLILSIIGKNRYERHILRRGGNSIPLNIASPETLTISIWKPGYRPLIRKLLAVPQRVVFGEPFFYGIAVPGDTLTINIIAFNYSGDALSFELNLEAVNASLLRENINGTLPPHSQDTLQVRLVPYNRETFTLRLTHDGLSETYRFPISTYSPHIVGAKWSDDSVKVDIYNPSSTTASVELTTRFETLHLEIPPSTVGSKTLYAPDSSLTIRIEAPQLRTKSTLIRADGPSPPKSVKAFSIPSGVQLYISNLPPSAHAFRIYRKRKGDLPGYRHVGITPAGSMVFVDHPGNYGTYCYRVSALDRYMNEGELSDEVCISPGPDYGFMKPISYAEQLYAQPVVGQFDRTTYPLELFLVGNVHIAFYNQNGIPYSGYPAIAMFEVRAKPVVADYDGDGFEEVILSGKGSMDNRSYVLALQLDGEIDTIYASDHPYDFALSGGLLAADMTGDGIPEIIFKNYYGNDPYAPRFILISGDSIMFQFRLNGDAFNYIIPAAADIDLDGKSEILFLDENKFLYALKGDSSMVDGFPVDLSGEIPGTINYTEVLGIDSIIVAISRTSEGDIFVSRISKDGTLLGTVHVASGLVHYYWQHSALGYIDSDSIPDLAIPTRDSLILVNLEGERIAPSMYQYLLGPYTMSSPILANVGTEGKTGIIFSNASMIHVYEYDGGQLAEYSGFPLVMADDSTMDSQGMFPPFVEDIDGNGYAELYIAMNRLGYVYQIESPPFRAIPWSQEFANRWNTNWYNFEPPSVPVSAGEVGKTPFPRISVYPDLLLLQGQAGTPYQLYIYSISGRKMKSFSGRIPASGQSRMSLTLPDGIYIVRGKVGTASVFQKMVKVR